MKAYELLADPERWARNKNELHGTLPRRHCVVTALIACYPLRWEWIQVTRKLREHLNLPDGEGIGDWNDTPGRTHAEVVALLKQHDL